MMVPDVELWSPERELRLLEEMAETEAKGFEMDFGLPSPVVAGPAEQVWVAYWNLPPDDTGKLRSRMRGKPVRV